MVNAAKGNGQVRRVRGAPRGLWPRYLTSGLALSAFAAGVAGLCYALFGPIFHETVIAGAGGRVMGTSHGLVDEGMSGPVIAMLSAFLVALVGIGMGGLLRLIRGCSLGDWLLLSSSALLFGLALLSFLTVGWLLLPSALL